MGKENIRPKGKKKQYQIYQIGNHMASPRKQKNRDMAGSGQKSETPVSNRAMCEISRCNSNSGRRHAIPVLSLVILRQKMKESVVVSGE